MATGDVMQVWVVFQIQVDRDMRREVRGIFATQELAKSFIAGEVAKGYEGVWLTTEVWIVNGAGEE